MYAEVLPQNERKESAVSVSNKVGREKTSLITGIDEKFIFKNLIEIQLNVVASSFLPNFIVLNIEKLQTMF